MARASATAGVQAIVGPDSYRAEEALERLLHAALGADRADAVQSFRGEEQTWVRLIDTARTGSLFASRRAVVVRGAEGLKGDGAELGAYLDDPTPGVTLVLMAVKPDKRRSVWKLVMEQATIVKADPLKGRELRSYVSQELRRRRLEVSDEGIRELLDRVGQDLRRLMGEIDKLEAFAGSGQSLSADDVDEVLGRGLARPLYQLADAFGERRAAEALQLMEKLLDEGEEPMRILVTLHRSLRQVRGALALGEARVPRDQVASRLGIFPFKVGDVLESTKRWSEPDLASALAAVGRADRRLKSGAEPRSALVAAVAEACVRPSGQPGS